MFATKPIKKGDLITEFAGHRYLTHDPLSSSDDASVGDNGSKGGSSMAAATLPPPLKDHEKRLM